MIEHILKLITPRFVKIIWMILLINSITPMMVSIITFLDYIFFKKCITLKVFHKTIIFFVVHSFLGLSKAYVLFNFTPKKIINTIELINESKGNNKSL